MESKAKKNCRIDFFEKVDVGRVRKVNQDFVKCGRLADGTSCYGIVCDGIGSSANGGVAAEMAVNEFGSFIEREITPKLSEEDIEFALRRGVEQVNALIHTHPEAQNTFVKMGTTLVMGVINNCILHVMNIGDSRCYVINENEIKQITTDHSVVQKLFEIGEITQEEAKNYPQKNVITRALGTEKSVEVDYFIQNLENFDGVLLCSDGLTNHVSDEKIHELFLSSPPEEFCDRLVECANYNGGSDNISTVFLHKFFI